MGAKMFDVSMGCAGLVDTYKIVRSSSNMASCPNILGAGGGGGESPKVFFFSLGVGRH